MNIVYVCKRCGRDWGDGSCCQCREHADSYTWSEAISEDAKREAEAKYPNCWASACGHVQAVLMLELRSAFEKLDKAGYK